MINRFFIIFTILISIFFIGCGIQEESDITKEQEISSEYTTLNIDKQIVSTESNGIWQNSWYINNTLYYLVKVKDSETVQSNLQLYAKIGDEKSKLLYVLESTSYTSVAIDGQGNAYYISRPNEEECFLVKMNDQGVELCRQLLSTDVMELIKKEMCVQSVATDAGYSIMTAYGTVATWDAQLNETGHVIPKWQSSVMEYDAEQNYGLLVGSEGGYIYYRIGNDLTLQMIDMIAGELKEEEAIEIPVVLNTGILSADPIRLYSGYDKGIYVSHNEGIYIYRDKENILEQSLDWIKSTVKMAIEEVLYIMQNRLQTYIDENIG